MLLNVYLYMHKHVFNNVGKIYPCQLHSTFLQLVMWSQLVLITIILSYPFSRNTASASTSVSLGFVPEEVIHTFIMKGLAPLLILPGLDCCPFPLALIIGYGNTKKPLNSGNNLPCFHYCQPPILTLLFGVLVGQFTVLFVLLCCVMLCCIFFLPVGLRASEGQCGQGKSELPLECLLCLHSGTLFYLESKVLGEQKLRKT